jgi:ketosteroid isomerase-like protein
MPRRAATVTGDLMPTPDHQLVRDYLDAYNRADWDVLASLLRPDYVHHNNGQSLDAAQFRRDG